MGDWPKNPRYIPLGGYGGAHKRKSQRGVDVSKFKAPKTHRKGGGGGKGPVNKGKKNDSCSCSVIIFLPFLAVFGALGMAGGYFIM